LSLPFQKKANPNFTAHTNEFYVISEPGNKLVLNDLTVGSASLKSKTIHLLITTLRFENSVIKLHP
jgi:hypothetical protein